MNLTKKNLELFNRLAKIPYCERCSIELEEVFWPQEDSTTIWKACPKCKIWHSYSRPAIQKNDETHN